MRFLYQSNYKTVSESKLLDKIVNAINIARPKARKIIKDLLNEKLLKITTDSFKRQYIAISEIGNTKLIEMFDESKETPDE